MPPQLSTGTASAEQIEMVNTQVVGRNVVDQYLSARELRDKLHEESSTAQRELSAALKQLRPAEKRLPPEIDLLKNDISAFQQQQSEKTGGIVKLVETTRKSPVFTELAELNEVKRRMLAVQELLLAVQQKKQPTSPEQAEQLAAVLANTPEEGRYANGGGYYKFINKIIN